MPEQDTLIAWGGEVKALGDGKVGGYLVRYTGPDNPDLVGDYFAPATDFDIEGERRLSVYYHHGQDRKLRNRKLGGGIVRPDDVGLWIEAQLNLRDEYEQAIYEMVQEGKAGWSSGAVGHLVTREQVGNAWLIKTWPIGEASITPTPAAGPDLTRVVTLKSLEAAVLEAGDTATDDATAGGDNDQPDTASREPIKGENEMTEQVQETAPAELDLTPVLEAIKGLGERIAVIEKRPTNEVGVAAQKAAPPVIKTRGDSFGASFRNWFLTGNDDGLKSFINGDALEVKASNDTDMNITTAPDGGDLVPTGFYNQIIARRDETSLVSRLPLLRIPGVGTTVDVPVDNEADGEFVSTSEANTFDRDAPAMAKKSLTLVKYTKRIQISDELMEDTPTNLMAFLAEWVGRGLAKTQNSLIITEVGTNGTSFDTLANTSSVAAGEPEILMGNDNLADYLNDDGALAWVMRPSTFWAIKSITGNARMYSENVDGGNTLLGHPVYFSQKVAAIGSGNKSYYFGNWRYVGFREAPSLTFLRNPYLLADTGQLALHYYFRTVFKVLQAEAVGFAVHPTS